MKCGKCALEFDEIIEYQFFYGKKPSSIVPTNTIRKDQSSANVSHIESKFYQFSIPICKKCLFKHRLLITLSGLLLILGVFIPILLYLFTKIEIYVLLAIYFIYILGGFGLYLLLLAFSRNGFFGDKFAITLKKKNLIKKGYNVFLPRDHFHKSI